MGFGVAFGLWWFLQKTRYGHIIRAAVFSREMVGALGIPIPRIYTGVFTLGIAIAGLAGAVQGPIGSITLGMDVSVVVQAFCVVVIGGFGSLLGTIVGAIIVGEVYAFSILLWPQGAHIRTSVYPDRPSLGPLWNPHEDMRESRKAGVLYEAE